MTMFLTEEHPESDKLLESQATRLRRSVAFQLRKYYCFTCYQLLMCMCIHESFRQLENKSFFYPIFLQMNLASESHRLSTLIAFLSLIGYCITSFAFLAEITTVVCLYFIIFSVSLIHFTYEHINNLSIYFVIMAIFWGILIFHMLDLMHIKQLQKKEQLQEKPPIGAA